jgi:bifunctional oligoribonuclease and PAP phosphatase NrnA
MFYPELSPRFVAMLGELDGQRVAVVGHARPDGDCIGSQVPLCRLLRARGIDAICVNSDPVPRRLAFLVGDTPFYQLPHPEAEGRVAVFVDCADPVRPGLQVGALYPSIFLNIDHHVSNTDYAERNLVEADSSATAEILAGLMLDNDLPIDRLSAQNLYVGIATDTGQFRFPSTTARVFEIVSRLLALGAHPAAASAELYERESSAKLALLQRFLASLKLEGDGRICVGLLPQSVFDETGATSEDTEGLVDYARSVDGVQVGVLIEERAGSIKGSLRAKEPSVRVDRVAAQFGGGGHAAAAGLNAKGATLDSFYPQLVEAICRQLDAVAAQS